MPYLRPAIDPDLGYYVVCPGCGEHFYGVESTEDVTTKSANRAAAEHYEREHLHS